MVTMVGGVLRAFFRGAIGTVRAQRPGSTVEVVMFTCSLRVAATSSYVGGGSSSSEGSLIANSLAGVASFFFGALFGFVAALGSCLHLEQPSDFPSAFFFSTSSLRRRWFSSSRAFFFSEGNMP